MHSTAGSPTEPSFASKLAEKSEQHEKIEKAKLASNARSRPSQASLLPPDLPPAIAAQLVTVTSPRDLLSAHTASNDRRLRRLLCRYSNQIQYGCKNLHCVVPSCLTCRARSSKTPIRKYTDATARALAAHIIEEQGEKGLCHSDPVVPWFETPGSRPRTRSAGAKIKANGHLKENGNRYPIGAANGHVVHPSCHNPSTPSTKVIERHLSSGSNKEENHAIKSQSSGHERAVSTSNDAAESALTHGQSVPLLKKDTKSFTQAIFDSLGLRSLWGPSPLETRPAAFRHVLSDVDDVSDSQQEDLQPHPCCVTQSLDDARSNAQLAMHDNKLAVAKTRTKDANPQFPDDRSSESTDLEQTAHLCGPRNGNNQINVHDTDKEVSEALRIKTSRISALNNVELPRKTDPEELGDNDWKEEDESQARVAPFLSRELLTFLHNWRFRTLRNSPQPWPDHWMPEPYADFMHNTMFFCLRDSGRILQSIQEWHEPLRKTATYDSNKLDGAIILGQTIHIAWLMPVNDSFRALRLGLADAYNLPLIWRNATTTRQIHDDHRACHEDSVDETTGDGKQDKHLSDEDTARLCAFGLLLLEAGIATRARSGTRPGQFDTKFSLEFVQICNSFAKVFPEQRPALAKESGLFEAVHGSRASSYRDFVAYTSDLIDYFDDYDAKRLFTRITDLVATRHAFGEMRNSRRKAVLGKKSKATPGVATLTADYLASWSRQAQEPGSGWNAVISTIEWTKLLFARDWNGNAVILKASPLGGSLQLLMAIFAKSREYTFPANHFYLPILAVRMNMVQMPVDWLSFRPDNKTVHLLAYPFLFEPHVLVSCFRAINYSRMSRAAVDARAYQKDVRDFTDGTRWPGAQRESPTPLFTALRPYMANNFVITVRRDNLLEDAIDQIWRRQRRELMRPLKVRMGMDEGEQGIDIGGVQQEFFRVLFAQALDPAYGMFTVDERTRMTWFRPGSLEPLYKFEVLGVFMSLAVYNSLTLPVTFPLAFYRKLLGLKVKKVHQIADGWPELTRGLQHMLAWTEGDVSDVFARTYEFSYEAFGKHVNINMRRFDKHTPWPPGKRKKGKEKVKTASFELPPECASKQVSDGKPASSNPLDGAAEKGDEEASLVTNSDREQYVKDYIIWLTHRSIEPQYKAFANGFYTCLDRTALSIFTPEALKLVVEGHTHIDIQGLEAATKYEDGYDGLSSTIQDFWHVVRSFSTEQHRRLLEFVTASDRVPVNGIKSVQFIIQRNGSGDERLPTSMTCFGRLLLPQYSSRQVLEAKLMKAIENSEGFGVA